ncbi:conserved hypothetical protein [uncultured Dysgonomonas sp.]|uniref:Formyl transferase N-terminal domain-containing protein n=1 Tax=uncultured Dysgonomonas sp. TaxID=206096 RepID=A0A212J778_9BACT|nr:formyltransferase family protein [uncultured Dysgonomonas sp.]SBV95309.1 conserved hypothetical protein [uncultured Dysgonomonas sp.]
MKVLVLGNKETKGYKEATALIQAKGHTIIEPGEVADVAVAPLLLDILSPGQIYAPKFGTLIFHPSPLPYGRGASSIKWAYKRKEPITAATWFWANLYKVDSGDICEQEIIKIDYSQSPREFYEAHIIPGLLRTLARALDNISSGTLRRIPQVEQYASFDLRA